MTRQNQSTIKEIQRQAQKTGKTLKLDRKPVNNGFITKFYLEKPGSMLYGENQE